jgi:uncharacterized protein
MPRKGKMLTVSNLARLSARGRAALGIAALLCIGVASATVAGCGSADPGVRPTSASRNFPLSDLQREILPAPNGNMLVYVMDTDAKRGEGMMYVQDIEWGGDRGMIFVYPDEQFRRYTGRNVIMPLDIAFIAADGTVLGKQNIIPFNETPIDSHVQAQYVLEARFGRLGVYGIEVGTKLTIPPTITAKE